MSIHKYFLTQSCSLKGNMSKAFKYKKWPANQKTLIKNNRIILEIFHHLFFSSTGNETDSIKYIKDNLCLCKQKKISNGNI